MTDNRWLPGWLRHVRDQRRAKLALATGIITLALAFTAVFWWAARQNLDSEPAPTLPIPRDLAPAAVVDPPFPALSYGVHTFLWWNEATRALDLYLVRLMNFSHVKQRFSWRDIEPVAGEWHWDYADAVVDDVTCQGTGLVARLDGPPDWAIRVPGDDPTAPPVDLDAWGEFCGAVAERYRGQIAGYQVWNEPNLRFEWLDRAPNAEGYVELLRVCSEAIHAADPDAVVISAGLAPTGTGLPDALPDMDYLRQMYDTGAGDYFDVLGLNAPGYKAPPEMSPDEAEAEFGHRWMAFRHVEDMRGIMVENGDGAKQIALLEMGWTTDQREDTIYSWHAVDEQTQAEYLVDAYRYAAEHWRPWVGLMVTIYLSDPSWTPDDEQYWWALDTPGYPTKPTRPAFIALANMEKVMGETVIPARDPSSPEAIAVEQIVACEN